MSGEPLKAEFFSKLESVLSNAGKQLSSFDCERREVFVFIEFDDSLNEYVENNLEQIKSWLASHNMLADRYYLFAHPAYYSATTFSPGPYVIVWPLE